VVHAGARGFGDSIDLRGYASCSWEKRLQYPEGSSTNAIPGFFELFETYLSLRFPLYRRTNSWKRSRTLAATLSIYVASQWITCLAANA
jgi:hypothetical protein